ncbi:N-terminal kinase-like protein, partial [Operophtera brumata]
VHGFLDTNAIIREQTVKSIVHLAPKLNYNNLNVEVLKHFARLQSKDDQGGIRTNTTVCLGKIAAHLHPQIRQKVLVSAFVRATRDAFPPARQAGVLALAATQQYFLLAEVANRILPALCSRRSFQNHQRLPWKTGEGLRGSEFERRHGNAAATWAGWAVTAVTAKFYRSHSDTARGQHPKSVLSKPGSLEQPSSSSMSTTTSSVTSMTSLERSDAKSPPSSGSAQAPTLAALCEDEWDNEDPSETWNNTQWTDAGVNNANATYVRNVASARLEHRPAAHQNSNDSLGGWEDGEFEPIEENADEHNASKMDELRRKREERKLQRQREMEARRSARGQGPMKLGTKITTAPQF